MSSNYKTTGPIAWMTRNSVAANLSYTTYNDEEYSVVEDRDYLSLSTTYNF